MQQPSRALRDWRLSLDLNQAEAAKAAAMHQSAWSEIEQGNRRPTLDQAFQIERVTSGRIPAKSWPDAAKLRRVRPVEVGAS